MLSGIDSLNNLTSDNEYEIEDKIRKYFEETDLPTDEIEKRIGFALDIERVFRDVFILMIASEMIKELEAKADYYSNMAYEGYIGAMEDNGYSVDPTGMGYVEQYARSRCKEIVDTAILHKADAFYGTLEHTIAIGEDEAMAVGNYYREQLAIAQGYTQKTWVTCQDDRVRESHRLVDGQTIGIFQPFHLKGGMMMFPLDSSLGVNKREIYGCRCMCDYSGKSESSASEKNNQSQATIDKYAKLDNEIYADFKNRLKNGQVNMELNVKSQREHLEGTEERRLRIIRDQEENNYGISGRFISSITEEDAHNLAKEYAGKGDDFVVDANSSITEYVSVDKRIGEYYNVGIKNWLPTDRIAIKYSKKGIHCYPIKYIESKKK